MLTFSSFYPQGLELVTIWKWTIELCLWTKFISPDKGTDHKLFVHVCCVCLRIGIFLVELYRRKLQTVPNYSTINFLGKIGTKNYLCTWTNRPSTIVDTKYLGFQQIQLSLVYFIQRICRIYLAASWFSCIYNSSISIELDGTDTNT